MKRDVPGFAVGGLSGGEAKEQFWRSGFTSLDKFEQVKTCLAPYFYSIFSINVQDGGGVSLQPPLHCT